MNKSGTQSFTSLYNKLIYNGLFNLILIFFYFIALSCIFIYSSCISILGVE
jgi:hypothetical protein